VPACVRASVRTCARAHARTLAHESLAYTRKGETLRSDLYPQSCQLSEPTRQNRCRHGSRTRSSPLHPSPHVRHSPLFRCPLPAPVLSRLVSLSLSLSSLSLSRATLLCVKQRGLSVLLRSSTDSSTSRSSDRGTDRALDASIFLSHRAKRIHRCCWIGVRTRRPRVCTRVVCGARCRGSV